MKRLTKAQRISEQRVYIINGVHFTMRMEDINFYPEMSDETLAFNATLIIEGSHTINKYNCKNNGCGASTDIVPQFDRDHPLRTNAYRDVAKMMDDYLHTVPDDGLIQFMKEQGCLVDELSCKKSLDGEVDNMLAVWCDKYGL